MRGVSRRTTAWGCDALTSEVINPGARVIVCANIPLVGHAIDVDPDVEGGIVFVQVVVTREFVRVVDPLPGSSDGVARDQNDD